MTQQSAECVDKDSTALEELADEVQRWPVHMQPLKSETVCLINPNSGQWLHGISWARVVHPRSGLHGFISPSPFQPQQRETRQDPGTKCSGVQVPTPLRVSDGGVKWDNTHEQMDKDPHKCRIPLVTWEHRPGLLTPRTLSSAAFFWDRVLTDKTKSIIPFPFITGPWQASPVSKLSLFCDFFSYVFICLFF